MRVKVIRGFRFGDKVYMPDPKKEKDVIVSLEPNQARAVFASNKAEAVDADEASAGPMTTAGPRKRGGGDADAQ